jgi:hypothetical protein
MMQEWQTSVTEFRCKLPLAEVARLRGSAEGWDCRDIQFHFGLVSFADLGVAREAELNAIPTRLSLPTKNIDDAIAAGFDAASGNATLKNYVQQRKPKPVNAPSP